MLAGKQSRLGQGGRKRTSKIGPSVSEACRRTIDGGSGEDGTNIEPCLIEADKASANRSWCQFGHVHWNSVGFDPWRESDWARSCSWILASHTHGHSIDQASGHQAPEAGDTALHDNSDQADGTQDHDGFSSAKAAGEITRNEAAHDPASNRSPASG